MSFGSGQIWKNGTLVDWADATIHVGAHIVHYGSGVFEGARCYNTPTGSACFRLGAHIRRLYDSAKIFRMTYELSHEKFEAAILETIRQNGYKECYIRPLLYRGYNTLGVDPLHCPVEAVIMVWEWGAYLGEDSVENGVDVQVSSWGRGAPNRYPSLAKATANYLNSQLIKMEAEINGYAEGIALDPAGFLSEGSGQNLFLVRDGALTTPPLASSALPGITRSCVMTVAEDLGIPVCEELQPREALYIADEVFLTGTAAEITPIKSVDRITIGSGTRGPITQMIQKRFFDIVHGREADTHGWLTSVYPDTRPSKVAATTAPARG